MADSQMKRESDLSISSDYLRQLLSKFEFTDVNLRSTTDGASNAKGDEEETQRTFVTLDPLTSKLEAEIAMSSASPKHIMEPEEAAKCRSIIDTLNGRIAACHKHILMEARIRDATLSMRKLDIIDSTKSDTGGHDDDSTAGNHVGTSTSEHARSPSILLADDPDVRIQGLLIDLVSMSSELYMRQMKLHRHTISIMAHQENQELYSDMGHLSLDNIQHSLEEELSRDGEDVMNIQSQGEDDEVNVDMLNFEFTPQDQHAMQKKIDELKTIIEEQKIELMAAKVPDERKSFNAANLRYLIQEFQRVSRELREDHFEIIKAERAEKRRLEKIIMRLRKNSRPE
ncbi:hypothetical protein CANCADRAFT_2896 [Tortispora caseinolytica NRRL Y-17796]|uniref:Uncharacterized protein n=1 Tax=Tortispora caseinolytica NRRL Y-17796 TaxID=767744 RepID=A0A1E4THE5_9ASCO|nr:hypothetical protein CANCADRAFT_2896 [Tortispora caseinolytica NRRL Y-17796]